MSLEKSIVPQKARDTCNIDVVKPVESITLSAGSEVVIGSGPHSVSGQPLTANQPFWVPEALIRPDEASWAWSAHEWYVAEGNIDLSQLPQARALHAGWHALGVRSTIPGFEHVHGTVRFYVRPEVNAITYDLQGSPGEDIIRLRVGEGSRTATAFVGPAGAEQTLQWEAFQRRPGTNGSDVGHYTIPIALDNEYFQMSVVNNVATITPKKTTDGASEAILVWLKATDGSGTKTFFTVRVRPAVVVPTPTPTAAPTPTVAPTPMGTPTPTPNPTPANLQRISNLSTYVVPDAVDGKYNHFKQMKDKSDNAYNTDASLTVEAMQSYWEKANITTLGSTVFGMHRDAGKALDHFLTKNGQARTLSSADVKRMVETPIGQYCLNKNLNNFMDDCEKLITTNETVTVGFRDYRHTMISPEGDKGFKVENGKTFSNLSSEINLTVYPSGIGIDEDWWYAIGNAYGYIVANVNRTGDKFVATMEYRIRDMYAWKKDSEAWLGPLLVDGNMSDLHRNSRRGWEWFIFHGSPVYWPVFWSSCREYEINGIYACTLEWTNGQKDKAKLTD